jgi:hypothetical protein
VVLVPTPIAERRALATARQRWWQSEIGVAGIPETYQQYMSRTDPRAALSRMVGEIERILSYPRLGFMTEPDQRVTTEVKEAYRRLRADFNGRPIPDQPSVREPLPV